MLSILIKIMINKCLTLAALLAVQSAVASHSRTFSAAVEQPNGVCNNPAGSELLDDYVDVLTACYDVDGDGILNRTEMTYMIAGQLCNHECPTSSLSSVGNSSLLTRADAAKLQTYFNGRAFRLSAIFSSQNGSSCDRTAYLRQVYQAGSDILIVAKSPQGHLFGGYRKRSCALQDQHKPDPDAFFFSLAANSVTYNKSPTLSGCTCFSNTEPWIESWNNELGFDVYNNQCMAWYIPGHAANY